MTSSRSYQIISGGVKIAFQRLGEDLAYLLFDNCQEKTKHCIFQNARLQKEPPAGLAVGAPLPQLRIPPFPPPLCTGGQTTWGVEMKPSQPEMIIIQSETMIGQPEMMIILGWIKEFEPILLQPFFPYVESKFCSPSFNPHFQLSKVILMILIIGEQLCILRIRGSSV